MSLSSKNMLDAEKSQPIELVEELEEMRAKYSNLDHERKAHYQLTQQQRQLNKDAITKYQKENKDMKEMLNMLKDKEQPPRRADN